MKFAGQGGGEPVFQTERFRSVQRPIVSIMNLNKRGLAWLALLLAGVSLTSRLAAAIPPAENLLPADTFFVLTAPSSAALRDATGDSPQLLLWNDPALRPFHDKFMGKWHEQFLGPLEQDLGVSLDSFLDLPQGQLTLAVTRNGWDGVDDQQTVGILLLLDAGDKSSELATNLAVLQKKWTDAGRPLRSETVHGVNFTVVTLSTNDVPPTIAALLPASQPVQELGRTPKPAKPVEMLIGQFQSLLIVGNSVRAVEPILAHLRGGSIPSLADNPNFAADKTSQFRDSPLYYSWLNAHGLFDIIARIPAAEPNPSAPSFFPAMSPSLILNASGLSGLKSVSLSYHQSHEGSLATLHFSIPDSSRQGLFKILATESKDASPPAFVPADAVKYWRWRLNSQNIWAELQKTLGGISPGMLGSLNGFIDMANSLAQQKDPSFDLRKDLLGNLGDDWISYEKGPSGNTVDQLSQSHGLLLFAAANPVQALLAFKTTAALYAPQEGAPAPRDFLGHTIYTLALRAQATPGGATAANALYCSVNSGYVAMSSDVSVLEEFLRSAGKPPQPLSGTPGLAEAAGHIGGMGNGLFGYEDHRVVMRAAFTSLKQAASGGGGAAQIGLGMLPKTFTDWLDFSLLPDYDQVAKYFYFSVFSGTTTPEGITFKGFYPRPPLLN
jgi:hypothetical protein